VDELRCEPLIDGNFRSPGHAPMIGV
jgi:hypothetical protein